MTRALLLTLLVAAALPAAPVPVARTVHVAPGRWLLLGWGSGWQVTLDADGGYAATSGSSRYVGSWAYNRETRVLTICERPDRPDSYWSVTHVGQEQIRRRP